MENESEESSAEYVFSVRFRLISRADVRLDPQTFEATLFMSADPPGEDGWLFFRDTLWRGAVSDESHMRDLAEDILGVPVESITFRELRTTAAYLDELKETISVELDTRAMFGNAANADEVLKNYLGSSIHVRPANQ
jgi:hypothetical protein